MNNDKTRPVFKGFTAGKHKSIDIPEQFFRDILPIIDNLAELKVILFCWRGLFQKAGEYRYSLFVYRCEAIEASLGIECDDVMTKKDDVLEKTDPLVTAFADIQVSESDFVNMVVKLPGA